MTLRIRAAVVLEYVAAGAIVSALAIATLAQRLRSHHVCTQTSHCLFCGIGICARCGWDRDGDLICETCFDRT